MTDGQAAWFEQALGKIGAAFQEGEIDFLVLKGKALAHG